MLRFFTQTNNPSPVVNDVDTRKPSDVSSYCYRILGQPDINLADLAQLYKVLHSARYHCVDADEPLVHNEADKLALCYRLLDFLIAQENTRTETNLSEPQRLALGLLRAWLHADFKDQLVKTLRLAVRNRFSGYSSITTQGFTQRTVKQLSPLELAILGEAPRELEQFTEIVSIAGVQNPHLSITYHSFVQMLFFDLALHYPDLSYKEIKPLLIRVLDTHDIINRLNAINNRCENKMVDFYNKIITNPAFNMALQNQFHQEWDELRKDVMQDLYTILPNAHVVTLMVWQAQTTLFHEQLVRHISHRSRTSRFMTPAPSNVYSPWFDDLAACLDGMCTQLGESLNQSVNLAHFNGPAATIITREKYFSASRPNFQIYFSEEDAISSEPDASHSDSSDSEADCSESSDWGTGSHPCACEQDDTLVIPARHQLLTLAENLFTTHITAILHDRKHPAWQSPLLQLIHIGPIIRERLTGLCLEHTTCEDQELDGIPLKPMRPRFSLQSN